MRQIRVALFSDITYFRSFKKMNSHTFVSNLPIPTLTQPLTPRRWHTIAFRPQPLKDTHNIVALVESGLTRPFNLLTGKQHLK